MNLPVKAVALIPARKGSKRIPGKNIRKLNGRALIDYTIRSAIEAGVFSQILVSTDCEVTAEIAMRAGAEVPRLRPVELAQDESPDIDWVMHAVSELISLPLRNEDLITILRPTNPFRNSKSIIQAATLLLESSWADSIRAMEITDKHPGKMWILNENNEAKPLLDQSLEAIPTHSRPTQSLPRVWVQNASLEIIKYGRLIQTKSISGKRIMAFPMSGIEGFDLNTELDWKFAELIAHQVNINF